MVWPDLTAAPLPAMSVVVVSLVSVPVPAVTFGLVFSAASAPAGSGLRGCPLGVPPGHPRRRAALVPAAGRPAPLISAVRLDLVAHRKCLLAGRAGAGQLARISPHPVWQLLGLAVAR